jgi:hypothetical protein
MSKKITGISTPWMGISWENRKLSEEYAQALIDFLCFRLVWVVQRVPVTDFAFKK